MEREAWLAERRKRIGASDVGPIMGLSPWTTPWEVWAEKTGRIEPFAGDDSTRAGQAFENAVLDAAEAKLGPLNRNVVVLHESLPLAATLDSQLISNGRPVEAKTTGLVGPVYGQWGDELTDQVPDYYLVQVHSQLLVTKQELGYLFALVAGRGVVEYNIEQSYKLEQIIGNFCDEWWTKHVVNGIEPERSPKVGLEVAKRLRKVPNKQIVFSGGEFSLFAEWDQAKRDYARAKESRDSLQSLLLVTMGDAESALLPDGRELTHFESNRKGYTVEPTRTRTLRIKGKAV